MKQCDLASGTAKLELAMKSLRVTMSAVESQWNDAAYRTLHDNHLVTIAPAVRGIFDAVAHFAEVLAAAERECGSESET